MNPEARYRIEINDRARVLRVGGGETLLSTLKREGISLPSACGGRGLCGMCRLKVLKGGTEVTAAERKKLGEAGLASGLRLACQLRVEGDLEIEIPSALLGGKDFRARVEHIEALTHDIRAIRFRPPADLDFSFRAGQYIQITIPPYAEVKTETARAYSLASPPSQRETFEVYVRRVPNGIVTTYLFEHLREGMELEISGPFGDFFLRESDRPIVCIAGGSGLGPIQSIIQDMIDRHLSRPTQFFFGAVNLRDLYRVEFFRGIEADHSWFRYIPALSGKEADHPYERGLITEVVERKTGTLLEHEAYLCGSPGMIEACLRVLQAKGLPEERIYFDKF